MPADPLAELRRREAIAVMTWAKLAAEDLLGEGQRRAPIREGTLRGSGAIAFIVNGHRFEGEGAFAEALAAALVEAITGTLRSVDAEVSFNTVYAARQHEETEWEHPRGGQAKYLEEPFKAKLPRYESALARSLERAI